MLDAYLRKGAQLPTELKAEIGSRRVIEDAITSTLFTPLRFMSPANVGQIVTIILGASDRRVADCCQVNLWPQLPRSQIKPSSRYVEPDLIVNLQYGTLNELLVFEIKWDAVLDVSQQKAQVVSSLIAMPATSVLRHISLVKFATPDALRYQSSHVRQWSSVLRDLQEAGRARPEISNVVAEWCHDAALLLRKLGIGAFEGLSTIRMRATACRHVDLSLRRFKWADLRSVDLITPRFATAQEKKCP
ncbi:hypothetical protein ACQR1Y_18835 [Bradyrhizobium sp. HKCCYLRH3099]|uniref:hypothetical protein n=1 Tax=unclassified Bradyrhizobium TaxID=2631580 RepID=UPI003EBB1566